ncbi:Regulator of protease activity HflC, stomatin/prohibitin superfamily [Nostoc flagelliforme CCNUN1]|uniref:Regulator of protease activity HflC, stomatin/prohibitin superfamily n=1 Tax=Nostoc flagelliforme CCNUN1 TaxID=2038116 RepID=A0A2K8SYJ6_9NOSO|nr:flotillin family protein [Nostoc flagelliforme]AUB40518.1 Regulator of protease activity HflC, stomatin/prohibitin superfamily [Nostoc flagelliforme CCNUN1]
MKSFSSLLGTRKQNKVARLAASIVATLAMAAPTSLTNTGSIHSANATSAKTTTASVQLNQTKPNISQLQISRTQYQAAGIDPFVLIPIVLVGGLVIFVPLFCGGLVVIGEREVGIVVRKFTLSGRGLPAGSLIALNGEAGLQADTLAPGWHWGYWPWQYSVKKESVIVVPQGEIALIVAADGASNPPERILGKIVGCDNFQDARKFLTEGGEKGRQMGFLTAGTYRINTALFKVIMAANASAHGMTPEQLRVYSLASDKVGIVTTLDGLPISAGELAGPIIDGHDNFQNGQKFINGGGRRGLQEQTLLSGSWNLNPWFVQVEQVPMTEIPIGYVGVVISFVGKAHQDVSGAAFTHGNLVNPGHKGVWVEPLYPGKHPINSRIMKMELVPTTNIVLNWSDRTERHSYDAQLASLTVRSRDGFAFDLEVAQIIHVGALDAPKVISRVGAMQNLVDHVLEPTIGNYFRNSAQDYTVLDFLTARSERQSEAAEYIKTALRAYDVQAIDTLIGDIQPPASLMQTQTDRKIAEEERKTYEVQQMAQTQRQQLVRETALADIQQEMVKSEQSVHIADLKAQAQIKQATGEAEGTKLRAIAEAEGIRATGNAKAETYRAGVEALGSQGYTAMQLMQIIGDRNVRLIPDVLVGSNGSNNGLVDGLLSMILWNQTGKGELTPTPLHPQPVVTKTQPTPENGHPPIVVNFPVDK